MIEHFNRLFPAAYSPLFTALHAGFMSFIALCGMAVVSPASTGAWLAVLLLGGVGMVLQFATKRVLVIRLYDSITYAIAAGASALLTWSVLVLAWGQDSAVLAATTITAMLISFGAITVFRDRRNPKRVRLPCAAIGKMDPYTGLIVDPRYIDRTPADAQRGNTATRAVLSLAPLIAGLSMMLVRGLPDDAAILLLLFPGILFAVMMTWFAAKYVSFLIGTIHWEREHDKRIYVKR